MSAVYRESRCNSLRLMYHQLHLQLVIHNRNKLPLLPLITLYNRQNFNLFRLSLPKRCYFICEHLLLSDETKSCLKLRARTNCQYLRKSSLSTIFLRLYFNLLALVTSVIRCLCFSSDVYGLFWTVSFFKLSPQHKMNTVILLYNL